MSAKLNMNTLTCREDAMRMTGGESPTVSRLYRIPGVDWLLAEQEKFSSSTSLRHVDLNGLPHDNTFGPLNTRSLTDVRDRPGKGRHLLARANSRRRTSPITNITRCTDKSLNHPVRRLASIRGNTPERQQWLETIRDMGT